MQSDYVREINRMTLQVGLVGLDGSVIASDQCMQQFEGGIRCVMTSSKFHQGTGVVCCWSGDSVAEHAANAVRVVNWNDIPGDKERIRAELIRIGDMTWEMREQFYKEAGQSLYLGIVRKVMVACHDSLWLLELGRRSSIANACSDRIVAGDPQNSARFFVNRYAAGCEQRPISKLVFLAAHAVLMGHFENPGGISGLEVAIIPKGSDPFFLTSAEIKDLAILSEGLSQSIGERLLQPLDYSPSAETKANQGP